MLTEMEALVRVVDAGSFSEAARRWGRSKAVVSKYVSQLEASLGVQLLHRTTRALRLTETGQAYLPRCRAILDELRELEASVQAQHVALRGSLRLTLPDGLGDAYLEPLLGGFQQRYPEVSLEVELTSRMVDLVEEGFDVALRVTSPRDSALVARRLAGVSIVAVASPDYLRRAGTPTEPGELRGHRCLVDTNFRDGARWPFRTRDGGDEVVVVEAAVGVNSPLAVRSLARQGLGVGLVPDFLVAEAIAAGHLIEVLPGRVALEWGIYVVYPRRKHLSGKVRAFVDHAAGVIAGAGTMEAG